MTDDINDKIWDIVCRLTNYYSNPYVTDSKPELNENQAVKRLESLVKSEIVKARQLERNEIIEHVKINQKGQFEDEAGHICWYLDDLLAELKRESKGS